MELTNLKVINEVLSKNGFSFKKSLGQNFLINPSVCPKMAENAMEDADYALEIGPGIGVLTVELAKRSKKTVAIELDERLKPVLAETLAEFSNVEVVFGDAMELDLPNYDVDAAFEICKRGAQSPDSRRSGFRHKARKQIPHGLRLVRNRFEHLLLQHEEGRHPSHDSWIHHFGAGGYCGARS